MWFLYALIGLIAGSILTAIIIAAGVPILGELIVDMTAEEEDIARFVFSIPLEDAVTNRLTFVRIKQGKNLKSLKSK